MSEKEISVTTDGVVLKGKIVDSVTAPISTVCKTADTILQVVDNVVGLPADFLNHHLKAFRKAYTEGYVKIPPKQRIEPTLRLGCSVLRNVAYSAEEPELQKLFAHLLLSASDTDYAPDVHPGYATVISEMTPHEAEVLNIHFGNPEQRPSADSIQLQKAYSNLIRLGLIAYRQRDYTENELTQFVGKRHYDSPRRIEDVPRIVVDIINDLQQLKNTVIQDRHKSTMPGRSELALTKFGSDFIRVVCGKVC
ncbi:Abi-alpha family protein [Vibrio parahaemolyticus]|uniref:Abi-alpha family protein n=1 Tax=Vibrio parahaemolyticus TaxID=670 RepID=UPI0032974445|nr:Abi-alpha family protein [Vibrio parahaemolyticus]